MLKDYLFDSLCNSSWILESSELPGNTQITLRTAGQIFLLAGCDGRKIFVIRPSANGDQVELSGSYWQKRGNFHPIFPRALRFCIYKFIKHRKCIESFLNPQGLLIKQHYS
jgi:hypothetical protein